MIKRIILILLAGFVGLELQAQTEERYGRAYWDAIPVTVSPETQTFTDIRNTIMANAYYPCRYVPEDNSGYAYTQGGAVYYKLDIGVSGEVIIHNWNSDRMGFSTIFLLKSTISDGMEDWSEGDFAFKRIAMFNEGDYMDPDFDPVALGMPTGSSLGLAYLHVRNLPAGTYYIVTAGYKHSNGSTPNGMLGTTIIVNLAAGIPGEPEIKPEQPNDNPVRYQYDLSGNRIKTIKR